VCSDGSQCKMAEGIATRATAETAGELAKLIASCGSDQAFALGKLRDDVAVPAKITTVAKLKDHPGAIARTREYIDYAAKGPAWALIDFDSKGMPPEVAARIEAGGGMWNALLRVAPGLQRAARVSRVSTSSGLYRQDTGESVSGSGGVHHYILVEDATDIKPFLCDLHDLCWHNELGWHLIGRAGQLLERSLVDRSVGYGERLCFEGAPVVVPPLAQDLTKRIPKLFEGEAVDTGLIVPRPTEYERHRVKEAKARSAEALSKAAAKIRAQYDETLVQQISARGVPTITARRLVAARHRGVLLPYFDLDFDHLGIASVADVLADPDRFTDETLADPNFDLDFDHLGIASVADVLADPDRFTDETLADPMEGADYGRCKAKIMRGDNGGLFIHSFAHGAQSIGSGTTRDQQKRQLGEFPSMVWLIMRWQSWPRPSWSRMNWTISLPRSPKPRALERRLSRTELRKNSANESKTRVRRQWLRSKMGA
jgi:hypothetical protein